MGIVQQIQNAANGLNNASWRRRLDEDALTDRDTELGAAWRSNRGSLVAHVFAWANVLLINRGMTSGKWLILAAWIAILSFGVFEVARLGKRIKP